MIKILCIKIDEQFDFNNYLKMFDKIVQNKITSFYHYKDRVVAFASELVKYYYLPKYLDISPENIDIQYSKFGKPYIKNSSLQFNISHSNDYLVIAISEKYQLGVDIEQYNYSIIPNQLSEVNFSLSEQLLIKNNVNNFYKLWTKKEALIKAFGNGFMVNNYSQIQLDLNYIQEIDNVTIYNTDLFNSYVLAICVLHN